MIYCPHSCRVLNAAAREKYARLPCPYEGCHASARIDGDCLYVAERVDYPPPTFTFVSANARAVSTYRRHVYRRTRVPGTECLVWADLGVD